MSAPVRARYTITAYADWSSAEPSYRGMADTLEGARYVASYLAEPLEPRDDFGRIEP